MKKFYAIFLVFGILILGVSTLAVAQEEAADEEISQADTLVEELE